MKSCMKGYALRKSRGRSWDILSEKTSGTHEQRMGATPEPQGAPGRIADSRVLLGRHSDATTVLGRYSDNRGIVGRLLDIQQSNNVPKSPENEMSVQLSPESEERTDCARTQRGHRVSPETERESEAQAEPESLVSHIKPGLKEKACGNAIYLAAHFALRKPLFSQNPLRFA